MTVKRNPEAFSNGLKNLDRYYSNYVGLIDAFKQKLKWNCVASQHTSIYSTAISRNK